MPISLRSWKRDGHNSNGKISSRYNDTSSLNNNGNSIQRISKEKRIPHNDHKRQKWSEICFRTGVTFSFLLLLLYFCNFSRYNYFEGHASNDQVGIMKSLFSTKKRIHTLRKNRKSKFPPREVVLEAQYTVIDENMFPLSRRSIFRNESKKKGKRRKKMRPVYLIRENRNRLEKLKNSEWYEDRARDPLYEVTEDGKDCVPMHQWQTISFPTCSIMHELSLLQKLRDDYFGYLTEGGYNTIFWIRSPVVKEVTVLKTLTYDTDHTDRNFDRVRRDALISERLTYSPHVMNIYGHCGHALLVPYSPESLSEKQLLNMTKQERFHHASTVIYALAHTHNIDGDGIPSVTHGDFALRQFNKVGNNYQLSDFNRGRFLRWDKRGNKTCPYNIGVNDGTFRSPEEYKYLPENAAIDVWALGNAIFKILTNEDAWPWESKKQEEKQQQKIINGEIPKLPPEIANSSNPVDQILKHVIYDMCFIYDPVKRATAVQIADYVREQTDQLETLHNK